MPAPYPQEFREDVVRVARSREDGVTLAQIAKDFGVHEMTLHKWIRQADIDDGSSTGDDDPDTTNTSASISLSYDLTQTVTTEVGYGYRSEVQDPTDAESHRVFFTIGREFSAGL